MYFPDKKWSNGQKKWSNGHFLKNFWPVKLAKKGLKRLKSSQKWLLLGCFWAKFDVFSSLWPKAHFFFIFIAIEKIYYFNKIYAKKWPNGQKRFLTVERRKSHGARTV